MIKRFDYYCYMILTEKFVFNSKIKCKVRKTIQKVELNYKRPNKLNQYIAWLRVNNKF